MKEKTKKDLEELEKQGKARKVVIEFPIKELRIVKQIKGHGLEHDTQRSGLSRDSQSSSPDP